MTPGSTSGTSENSSARTCKRQAYQRFRVEIWSRPPRPTGGRPELLCNPLKSLTFARPARPAPKGGTNPAGRAPTGAPSSVVKNKKLAARISWLPMAAAGEYHCCKGSTVRGNTANRQTGSADTGSSSASSCRRSSCSLPQFFAVRASSSAPSVNRPINPHIFTARHSRCRDRRAAMDRRLRSAMAATEYCPVFHLPCFGPRGAPPAAPCDRQTGVPKAAALRHRCPARVRAWQIFPGKSGPKRPRGIPGAVISTSMELTVYQLNFTSFEPRQPVISGI
jgi:hypothetical protein